MPDRGAVIYRYDGSFAGFLSVVFASFEKREQPVQIMSRDQIQTVLFPIKEIETDKEKASRVRAGIRSRMSENGWQKVRLGFDTCHPEKELLLLRFIRLGMRLGKRVCWMLADDTVAELENALKHLTGEAHQYKGFVRFSEAGGVLAAVIEPKNRVLPLLAPHFSDRYANEAFLIFDKTHREMLLYRPHRYVIIPVENYELPLPGTEERLFRSLWKSYYETIGIKERENPRCRMGHMQKRYWKHLTEMDSDVPPRIDGQDGLPTDGHKLKDRIQLTDTADSSL